MTYKLAIKIAKPILHMLCTFIGILLFPLLANAQSFIVKQRYHEGNYYLATEDYRPGKNNKYFAVDMETAKQFPDTVFARQLFKYQIGTDGPMQDFVHDTATSKQKYKLMKWRDKQPGSLYYRDIKAFDEILNRDEDLMKKKKKEDKKNKIYNQYYEPSSVIVFHERSERYFLFGTYGIYSVHQDSVQMPANTAFEYTGFRFKGLASAKLFNPNVFIMEFEIGPDKKFYKVFDMLAGTFANVPGLDELDGVKCLPSRSSPYAVFYGSSKDPKDYHQRTILYNYATMKVESNLRFTTPDINYISTLYLHNQILFAKYEGNWNNRGLYAYELKNNGNVLFSYKLNYP